MYRKVMVFRLGFKFSASEEEQGASFLGITVNNHEELKRTLNLVYALGEKGYIVKDKSYSVDKGILYPMEGNEDFPAHVHVISKVNDQLVTMYTSKDYLIFTGVNSTYVKGSHIEEIEGALKSMFKGYTKDTYDIELVVNGKNTMDKYKGATDISDDAHQLSFTSSSGRKVVYMKRYLIMYKIEKEKVA